MVDGFDPDAIVLVDVEVVVDVDVVVVANVAVVVGFGDAGVINMMVKVELTIVVGAVIVESMAAAAVVVDG